jgi:hypothetical protein
MAVTAITMPIVVIFEQHQDEAAKNLERRLLPVLAEESYDTFCLEAPQDFSEQDLLSSFNITLKYSQDVHSDAKRQGLFIRKI